MLTPKQIMAESARSETSKRSDFDGSQLNQRPFPVYIVEYKESKNAVIVKRKGDTSYSKKEYPLFHHPKEMGHLSPQPGDKVYFYPRGIGDSGSVVMYGHDSEKEADIRKANPSLYT
jgi:hypothetical protein